MPDEQSKVRLLIPAGLASEDFLAQCGLSTYSKHTYLTSPNDPYQILAYRLPYSSVDLGLFRPHHRMIETGIPFMLEEAIYPSSRPFKQWVASMYTSNGQHVLTRFIPSSIPYEIEVLSQAVHAAARMRPAQRQVSIEQSVKALYDQTHMPQWDNQVEYGKRHRARRLLRTA